MIETDSRFTVPAPHDHPRSRPRLIAAPRVMTRCACAGISFEEVARDLRVGRLVLSEILGRTGCAGTCTACLPDLTRYLEAINAQSPRYDAVLD